MQTFTYALVNCFISTYEFFPILIFSPLSILEGGVIEQPSWHFDSNKGQPTREILKILEIYSGFLMMKEKTLLSSSSGSWINLNSVNNDVT